MPPSRTNTALSEHARAALAYWPQIQHAAAVGMTTADMWATIRASAADLGLETPGVTVQGVSALRGIASGIERTAAGLNRAESNRRLISDMISTPPWARPPGEQRADHVYQVRFLHTTLQDGIEQADWRTITFSGRLPRTVGQLRQLAEGDAIQLARKYKGEHAGIDSLQLFAV